MLDGERLSRSRIWNAGVHRGIGQPNNCNNNWANKGLTEPTYPLVVVGTADFFGNVIVSGLSSSNRCHPQQEVFFARLLLCKSIRPSPALSPA